MDTWNSGFMDVLKQVTLPTCNLEFLGMFVSMKELNSATLPEFSFNDLFYSFYYLMRYF